MAGLFDEARRVVGRAPPGTVEARQPDAPPPYDASAPFTAFARDVFAVELTPGQRVLCAVAFDGVEPGDLQGADRELARAIFGDVDTIPPGARAVLCAVCGARGGKTYLLGALRLLHLALTVSLESMAPGEAAAGVIVAPDIRLARQGLRYVSGALQAAGPSIATIEAETVDSITLRRHDGNVVDIVCLPATRGGSALRGRTLVGAVLDEAAFFRDADFVVNDEELFKAIAPRVVPDGQVVIASTPWADAGLLYDTFTRNHSHPVDAIAAHAPTLLLRDDDHTRQLVERERTRDPENCAREFDADFISGGGAEFFGAADVALALTKGAGPLEKVRFDQTVVLGLDTAFRKDPTAGAVVTRDIHGLVTVLDMIEIRPPKDGRLVPSETIKQLIARGKALGATEVVCDGHYVETVREYLDGLRLIEAPGGQQGKADTHIATRTILREGNAAIPPEFNRLAVQLRQVIGKPQPGGGLSITSPRRGGAHGDIASGYVLACWRLSEDAGPLEAKGTEPSDWQREKQKFVPSGRANKVRGY